MTNWDEERKKTEDDPNVDLSRVRISEDLRKISENKNVFSKLKSWLTRR